MTDAASPPPEELLDATQLESFAEIGLEDFKEILDDMIANVPGMLTRLDETMAANDAVTGRSIAHSLRGMVLNFGCTGMAAWLRGLEHYWLDAGHDPAVISRGLRACWEATHRALDRWVATRGG